MPFGMNCGRGLHIKSTNLSISPVQSSGPVGVHPLLKHCIIPSLDQAHLIGNCILINFSTILFSHLSCSGLRRCTVSGVSFATRTSIMIRSIILPILVVCLIGPPREKIAKTRNRWPSVHANGFRTKFVMRRRSRRKFKTK